MLSHADFSKYIAREMLDLIKKYNMIESSENIDNAPLEMMIEKLIKYGYLNTDVHDPDIEENMSLFPTNHLSHFMIAPNKPACSEVEAACEVLLMMLEKLSKEEAFDQYTQTTNPPILITTGLLCAQAISLMFKMHPLGSKCVISKPNPILLAYNLVSLEEDITQAEWNEMEIRSLHLLGIIDSRTQNDTISDEPKELTVIFSKPPALKREHEFENPAAKRKPGSKD